MNRRRFLQASAVGAGALVLAGGGLWYGRQRTLESLTLESVLQQLDRFSGVEVVSLGAWNAAQVFAHCAQSIEYSITGYPQHKSAVFKQTVGPLAFSVFAARGKMHHNLGEPIPGAPELESRQDSQAALARLRQALLAFERHTGGFAPHFAYGAMNKSDYRLAHLMHLNNHFEELAVVSAEA